MSISVEMYEAKLHCLWQKRPEESIACELATTTQEPKFPGDKPWLWPSLSAVQLITRHPLDGTPRSHRPLQEMG